MVLSHPSNLDPSFKKMYISLESSVGKLKRRSYLYGIPDKYTKVISSMYENNIAAVKVRNEVSSWFRVNSGV